MFVINELNALFSQRLKAVCEQKGVTVRELSIESGVSRNTIYTILAGTSQSIRATTLLRICAGLGMTAREFFDDDRFN